jgi:predicted RND superfamily exporter protein
VTGEIERTRAWRFFWAVTAYPRTVVGLCLLTIIGALSVLPWLTKDTRAEAFIQDDHPALVYREKVQEIFGLADPIVVAIVKKGPEGVFNPATLGLLRHLSDEIADLPGVNSERVTSLATEDDIIGTEDGMLVQPFFEEPPETQAEADAIRKSVLGFELYVDSLVARDGGATLIIAELEEEEAGEQVYWDVLALIEAAPHNGEEIYVAGEGAVVARMGAYIDSDAARLNPISAVVITLILFIAYRTLRGVILPNLIVLGTVASALGAMVLAGVPIYVITNGLPPLLIAIAVADGIHILGQYYEDLAERPEAPARELAVSAMVHMWRPVTATSLTDIAGFMAIAAASVMPPMRAFGIYASVGVFAALALSLLLIPAALTLVRPKPSGAFRRLADGNSPPTVDGFGRSMSRFGTFITRHPRPVLVASAVIATVGVFGALRLEMNESRIRVFNRSDPIFKADAAINRHLSGTNYLDVVVETPEPEDLLRPDHLRRIEALQRFLETLPHVASTTSIVDYLKQMNRAMNEDRTEMYRVPDSPELAAQYFLLYSVSGDPGAFEKEIDYDYRLANVRAALDSGYFNDTGPVIDAAKEYIEETFNAPGIQASLAGRVNVDYHWGLDLEVSHYRGMALALIAVWAMAVLSFRSFVAGTFAIVPVVSAVLFVYAVMGFGEIWLGVGTTMFAAIGIGTGIDFAVHTMDRLVAATRDRGEPLEAALGNLFPSTGRALLFSFAALFLGFGVLLTSHVPPLVRFGTLVGVAVGTAFVVSLTALPALVLVTRPSFLQPRRGGSRDRKSVAKAAAILMGLSLLGPAAVRADEVGDDDAIIELDGLSGDEIVQRINARDDGARMTRRLEMKLIDRRGKERVRETFGFRKYYGDEKRTVLFYESPKNVKGTGFLTFDYPEPDRDDDQWLYLPALRKVRRISASDRGDYFLGTDLTYEDMKKEGKLSQADYSHRKTGVEEVDGHSCYVVEHVPVNEQIAKELGYGRVVTYTDAEIWVTRKSDFWDPKGKHLKTIRVAEIREIDGIWTAHAFEVQNHKTGHRTVFSISEVDYQAPIDDDVFTERSLRRGL